MSGGVEVQLQCSALCPSHFTPGTHWIGGWVVGPRGGLDAMAQRSIPLMGNETVIWPAASSLY